MAEPHLSDESLMLAFKAGEVRAFEELVRRHRVAVFNFVLRFTGQRSLAEDLLQETWLKVIRAAPGYQARAKFTTWVFTIARNLSVDAVRRDQHRNAESLDAPDPAAEDARPRIEREPSRDASPERAAHNEALRPALQRALSRLPPEQREVFILREYQGIGFKEIAEVTGVAEGTVKSRMRYALEGLRRTLGELGIDGDLAEEPPTRTFA